MTRAFYEKPFRTQPPATSPNKHLVSNCPCDSSAVRGSTLTLMMWCFNMALENTTSLATKANNHNNLVVESKIIALK